MNTLLSLVGAIAVASTAASAQTNLAIATPYQDGLYHTKNIVQFAKDVEAMTGGDVVFTLHTNASLLKMPEIMRGVQTNQVQIGEILLSAYGQESPFFEVDGIPFLSGGQSDSWRLYELTLPYITKRLDEKGLIPLFSVPWPGQGIYTQSPITQVADLQGVKFRAYNAVTARFAELLGAVPTTVQSAEVPQAFATGVVSAMITSSATGNDTQAWDFTTHYYDVNAINNKNIVFMNRDAFEALSAENQAALLAAAAKAETRGWILADTLQVDLTENLAKNGMSVEQANPAFRAELIAIGDTLFNEWLGKAGEDGAAFSAAYKAGK